jgi:hypothetical protein
MGNHFECLGSLFRSIPSLEIEGASGFALVTPAAARWFHECRPGDHAACSRHHPGIAGSPAGIPAERRDPVTSNYVRVTALAGLFAEARELSVRTLIFDVEPLVAPWHGSQESLDQGIARILGGVTTVPSVRVVIFATNSARRPSAVPACDGLQVRYLASAGKPLRTAPYHDLPRPGAVAGDQLPTDGILAYRLGFTFLHYAPKLTGVPLGPGLMHRWGELVRPVLFRRSDTDR